MTKPAHAVTAGTSVVTAAKRMRDAGIEFLPVCDAAGRPVGAITAGAITHRFVANELPSSALVSQIMERSVVTCRVRDDIFEAQKIMREEHVPRLVCLDDDGLVAGILTLRDLARHEDGLRLAKTVRAVLPVVKRP